MSVFNGKRCVSWLQCSDAIIQCTVHCEFWLSGRFRYDNSLCNYLMQHSPSQNDRETWAERRKKIIENTKIRLMMAWYYSDDADDAADVNEKPFSYAHILHGLTGLRVNMACWILEGEKNYAQFIKQRTKEIQIFFSGNRGFFQSLFLYVSHSLTHSFQIIALLIK